MQPAQRRAGREEVIRFLAVGVEILSAYQRNPASRLRIDVCWAHSRVPVLSLLHWVARDVRDVLRICVRVGASRQPSASPVRFASAPSPPNAATNNSPNASLKCAGPPTTPPRPRKSGLALLAVNMTGMLDRSRDVTAVAWAVSMAAVLTTRRSDPPGDPALSLPSQLGCRVELSVGSYRRGRRTVSGRCPSSSGRRWPVLLPQRKGRERQHHRPVFS
jgi:hypothetical protein